MRRYAAQKLRNEAYHTVLSPVLGSGRDGDVPSLHDRLQEAVPDEPLAVRTREVGGADGDDATLLEQVQGVQGTGQFL